MESASKRVRLSIENSIDELKPVVADKSHIEKRGIDNDGIFQNFQTLWFVSQDTKPPIFQSSTLLEVERF